MLRKTEFVLMEFYEGEIKRDQTIIETTVFRLILLVTNINSSRNFNNTRNLQNEQFNTLHKCIGFSSVHKFAL